MITLNIDPEGGITISQETPGERRLMHDLYQQPTLGEEGAPPSETERDDERAAFFKQGWDAAIRECQLNFVNGRLVEFFNEVGSEDRSEDPHHDEPEGIGEVLDDVPAAAWGETQVVMNFESVPDADEVRKIAHEVVKDGGVLTINVEGKESVVKLSPEETAAMEAVHAANEIGLNVIRPVGDSGEPEKEQSIGAETTDGGGTWTMSQDEMQSRLDASYERGLVDGQLAKRHTTERALRIIAVEEDNRLRNEGAYSEEKRGGVFGVFAIAVAKRLGFEVSA